ncbi:TPA: glycosyltransferase family 2 protein [Pasteurella multocida]|nr:glycosyltransferase family 2 protein [Pasteurella multocida]HDX1191875.1 glycosyltransferase family 2 protein [Pasteurella multocida]
MLSLFKIIKKYVHIQSLLHKKEYALLYAKYINLLSINQQAYVICQLKLYDLFLIDPKWSHSVFFQLGLIIRGHYPHNDESVRRLIACADFRKNRQLIIAQLLAYSPQIAKALCPNTYRYHGLYLALLANLKDFVGLKEELTKSTSFILKNTPHYFLIKNFVEKENSKKLENINQFLSFYKLENITTINKKNPPNTNNIVSHTAVSDTKTYLYTPLITVLVTTFNSQKSIKNTLNSLFNQSYPNIEIIVIDDHSQDNTMSILQAYTKQYKNIKIISLKENVGTYVAKNIGLKYASGEFITCQDSDDWAHPQKLALQVAPLLQHKELIVTFSKWVRLDPIGNPYARTIYPLMRLNPSSALFRKKEVCEKTALWDWVRIGADSEFNARLKLIFGHKGYYTVNKPLTFGAHRENSLMTAQSTGYVNGVSLPREAYWKAWNIWHISQLQRGHTPLLSSSPKREFFQYDQHPIMDVISYTIIN